jgi:hypothetical protein
VLSATNGVTNTSVQMALVGTDRDRGGVR